MESFSEEVKALYGDRDEPAKIEEALSRFAPPPRSTSMNRSRRRASPGAVSFSES